MHAEAIILLKLPLNYRLWSNQKLVAIKIKLKLIKSGESCHWNLIEIFMGDNLTIINDWFPYFLLQYHSSLICTSIPECWHLWLCHTYIVLKGHIKVSFIISLKFLQFQQIFQYLNEITHVLPNTQGIIYHTVH